MLDGGSFGVRERGRVGRGFRRTAHLEQVIRVQRHAHHLRRARLARVLPSHLARVLPSHLARVTPSASPLEVDAWTRRPRGSRPRARDANARGDAGRRQRRRHRGPSRRWMSADPGAEACVTRAAKKKNEHLSSFSRVMLLMYTDAGATPPPPFAPPSPLPLLPPHLPSPPSPPPPPSRVASPPRRPPPAAR